MEVEGSHESSSPCPEPPTGARITGCDPEAAAASAESSAAAVASAAPLSADAAPASDAGQVTSSPAAAAAPGPGESLAEIPVPRPRSISDMEMAVLQVSQLPYKQRWLALKRGTINKLYYTTTNLHLMYIALILCGYDFILFYL